MVVGFTKVYICNQCLSHCCEFESRSTSATGEVYSIKHYVIKFVSDLWQVCGFLRVLRFPPPIKHTMLSIVVQTTKVNMNFDIVYVCLSLVSINIFYRKQVWRLVKFFSNRVSILRFLIIYRRSGVMTVFFF